ncbi:Hypothetical_protein [Hexamita inflata]|uniref:Hypothetical_protein n=1 Tax=Hexamita inflata TaxID=28002 RepID=A0ABP1GKZ1_9EUKA
MQDHFIDRFQFSFIYTIYNIKFGFELTYHLAVRDRQAVGRQTVTRKRGQDIRALSQRSRTRREERGVPHQVTNTTIQLLSLNNNILDHSLFQNISAQCFTSMSISSWCSFMYSMTLSCSFSWVHYMIGFWQIWSSRGCSKRSNSASMISVERKCNQMRLETQ